MIIDYLLQTEYCIILRVLTPCFFDIARCFLGGIVVDTINLQTAFVK